MSQRMNLTKERTQKQIAQLKELHLKLVGRVSPMKGKTQTDKCKRLSKERAIETGLGNYEHNKGFRVYADSGKKRENLKITKKDVEDMKYLRNSGSSLTEIKAIFGVSNSTILWHTNDIWREKRIMQLRKNKIEKYKKQELTKVI